MNLGDLCPELCFPVTSSLLWVWLFLLQYLAKNPCNYTQGDLSHICVPAHCCRSLFLGTVVVLRANALLFPIRWGLPPNSALQPLLGPGLRLIVESQCCRMPGHLASCPTGFLQLPKPITPKQGLSFRASYSQTNSSENV